MKLAKLYSLLLNDKLQHFVYGVAIYSIFVPFGIVVAHVATLLIAYIKERFDSKGYGTPDVKDILATQAGAVFLMTWYYLIAQLQVYIAGLSTLV